ncbi:hypothetical protein I8748_25315 [Nostoc sp. CENA67]|uniref:Uncharacterized protein n=1 Tax=Amazonocrinis nigriterrae CENA67 TaxID=2794033 RepID=A0A8J7HZL6_9NOST|nr:hypothetical protein [Amazonocrinis nigriterrae]MBH8565454.1 hypothetical protein [Amazonocrinis nigriterrae CENA67]
MNNFYHPLSASSTLPSNPLPATIPLSPISIPKENPGILYPAPVFLLPQSSQLTI